MLQPDDTIIVCSDGIYRSVSDGEIADAFRRSSPAKACEAIQSAVLAKGRSRQDNLTIIAIRCQQSGVSAQPLPAVRRKTVSPFLIAGLAVELAAVASLGGLYAIKLKHEADARNAHPAQHVPVSPTHPPKISPPAPSSGSPSNKDQKPSAAKPATTPAKDTAPKSGDAGSSSTGAHKDGQGATTPVQNPVTPGQGATAPGQSAPTSASQAAAAAAKAMQSQQQPSHSAQHKQAPESHGGPQ